MKKQEMTLQELVVSKRKKRPNQLFYSFLGTFVAKPFIANKFKPIYNFKCDLKKVKGPYILISKLKVFFKALRISSSMVGKSS